MPAGLGRAISFRASAWLALALAACRTPAPNATAATPSAAVPSKQDPSESFAHGVHPARLFLLPSEEALAAAAPEWDGGRRLVVRGMRIVVRPDGEIARAADLVPDGQLLAGLELPARLGGGFLFYVHSSNSSELWRAQSWTSELIPFAAVQLPLERVFAGLDRIYAQVKRTRDLLAFDPETGALLDVGPLPRAPHYGNAAFVDGWFGAVSVPFRGVLVTFDAGATWHETGVAHNPPLKIDGGRLLIAETPEEGATPASRPWLSLDAAGALSRIPGSRGGADKEGSEPKPEPAPLGPVHYGFPLAEVALSGHPDTNDSAVLVREGALTRIRLEDGKTLDTSPNVVPADFRCQGLGLGKNFGFVCSRERGPTLLFEFEPPLGLRELLRFEEPRFISSSGNGNVVVQGACGATAERDATYCVRFEGGRLHEMRIRGDAGVERVVALADGRIAVIVPPRLGAEGRLTLVAPDGKSTSTALALSKEDADVHALLMNGLWLQGFWEEGGQLAGWVKSNVPFVGVRVALNGKVSTGEMRTNAERVFLSGPLGLALRDGGAVEETTNGGFDWREAATPPGVEPDLPTEQDAPQGCTPVGCRFGHWLRVGWTGRGRPEKLTVAESPKPRTPPAPGGTRRSLACRATGERSRSSLQAAPEERRAVGRERRPPDEEPAWPPFLDEPPPALKDGDVGVAGGSLRGGPNFFAYVWGTSGPSWDRTQRWLLRVFDRFDAKAGPWSTAVGRSEFPSPELASRFVGRDASFPSTLVFEPETDRQGGIGLSINTAGIHAFIAEAEHAPRNLGDVSAWGLRSLSGAAKVAETWYFGALGAESYRVFRVIGSKLELVREFELKREERFDEVSLVRNLRGDALGIWTRGAHWHVLPLDLESGRAGPAQRYSAREWSTAPACGYTADGWLLETVLPLQPDVEVYGVPEAIQARRVTARFVGGLDRICIAALAADTEPDGGNLEKTMASAIGAARGAQERRTTVPMALTDLRPGGRRWAFRCAL